MVGSPKDISSELNRQPPSSYGKYDLPEDRALDVIVDGAPISIPKGFTALVVQPRMCGDYYAELSGLRGKAATGLTRLEAVQSVIARAESSAS